jgi:hypothetical protein
MKFIHVVWNKTMHVYKDIYSFGVVRYENVIVLNIKNGLLIYS